MKKIAKIGIVLFLGISLTLSLNSCQKLVDDATETSTSAENATQDMAAISAITDMAQDVVSTAGFMMKNGNPIVPESATIEYVDTIFTDGDGIRIDIDFGSIDDQYSIEDDIQGVEGGNGAIYLGEYYIMASHPYNDPNCVITVEMNGKVLIEKGENRYVIDDGNLAGGPAKELTITRNGSGWKAEYSLSIDACYDTERPSKRKRKNMSLCVGSFDINMIDGGQPGVLDDEIRVTGGSENKNEEGTEYTVTITEDLVRVGTPGCSNTFTKGKMTLKNDGSKFEVKADFGDGSCDNLVDILLPGNQKQTISLD